MNFKSAINRCAVIAIGTLAASSARATPRTLPFTYPYETLPEGSAEMEHFIDSTWVRIPRTADPAETRTTFAPNFQHNTEFEYGVTDDFAYNIAKDGVHLRDLHATILHCMGIDHERFTYKFRGLNVKLTGVEEAHVVKGVLA